MSEVRTAEASRSKFQAQTNMTPSLSLPNWTLPFSIPAMTAEDTPLLSSESASVLNHDTVYKRFSPARKTVILVMISCCGILPCSCHREAIENNAASC